MRRGFLIGLCCLSWSIIHAQDAVPHTSLEQEDAKFRISGVLAHTYIPTMKQEQRKLLALPSFGLDMEYWWSQEWGIGIHSDLELETFVVETSEEVSLERAFPLVLTVDGLWKVYKGLVIVFGVGAELEATENYFLGRIGLEYEIEINEQWDIAPTIFHDARSGAFNTWSVGIGVGLNLYN